MHRRLRHLNPAHAGADAYYDTRYITGVSNNSAVDTWADKTKNGRNATGTGTQRPTYITPAQAGQPCLRATQIDQTRMTITSYPTYTGVCSMISVIKTTGVSPRAIFFGGGDVSAQSTFFGDSPPYFLWRDETDQGLTVLVTIPSTPETWVGVRSGTGADQSEVWQNGISIGTAAISSSLIPKNLFMRQYQGGGQYSIGDFYYGAIFPTALSRPLYRRLGISAAISFKIGFN